MQGGSGLNNQQNSVKRKVEMRPHYMLDMPETTMRIIRKCHKHCPDPDFREAATMKPLKIILMLILMFLYDGCATESY